MEYLSGDGMKKKKKRTWKEGVYILVESSAWSCVQEASLAANLSSKASCDAYLLSDWS